MWMVPFVRLELGWGVNSYGWIGCSRFVEPELLFSSRSRSTLLWPAGENAATVKWPMLKCSLDVLSNCPNKPVVGMKQWGVSVGFTRCCQTQPAWEWQSHCLACVTVSWKAGAVADGRTCQMESWSKRNFQSSFPTFRSFSPILPPAQCDHETPSRWTKPSFTIHPIFSPTSVPLHLPPLPICRANMKGPPLQQSCCQSPLYWQ